MGSSPTVRHQGLNHTPTTRFPPSSTRLSHSPLNQFLHPYENNSIVLFCFTPSLTSQIWSSWLPATHTQRIRWWLLGIDDTCIIDLLFEWIRVSESWNKQAEAEKQAQRMSGWTANTKNLDLGNVSVPIFIRLIIDEEEIAPLIRSNDLTLFRTLTAVLLLFTAKAGDGWDGSSLIRFYPDVF